MILGGGIFGLTVLALWIYCIIDVITTDDALMRNLPKGLWLIVVIFVPTIGSIVWLVAGRPQEKAFAIASDGPSRRVTNPRDADWAERTDIDPIVRYREEQARLRMWEEQLRRREEELRRREGGTGAPPPSG